MKPNHRTVPIAVRRALAAAMLVVVACASSTATAGAASTSTTAARLGATCRSLGQRSGIAPNQLVCQRSAARKLVWTRAAVSPSSGSTAPGVGATASFVSRPSVNDVASAVALLNAQGSAGFAYIGPFFVGGASHELFVKVDATTTYTYEAVEKTAEASSANGLLTLLRAKGKDGLLYKGPALFAGDFSKTYLLFVRSSAKKTTYTYRGGVWPTDEATMGKELNSNGADGFRYVGDFIPDASQLTVGLRLFVKDDKSADTFDYVLKAQTSDRSQFLVEATAMGQDRMVWRGGYVFGAGTPEMQTRSLYEKSASTKQPVTYSFVTPTPTSIDQLVAAANDSAKKGEVLWGQYQFGTETVSVYVNGPLSFPPIVGVVVP